MDSAVAARSLFPGLGRILQRPGVQLPGLLRVTGGSVQPARELRPLARQIDHLGPDGSAGFAGRWLSAGVAQ
jgi:hypothetical protein